MTAFRWKNRLMTVFGKKECDAIQRELSYVLSQLFYLICHGSYLHHLFGGSMFSTSIFLQLYYITFNL